MGTEHRAIILQIKYTGSLVPHQKKENLQFQKSKMGSLHEIHRAKN